VAALLGGAWSRRRHDPLAHVALTAVLLMTIGVGLLANLTLFTDNQTWTLVDAEGIAVAEAVREQTPADAVFVTGTSYSNPIATLTGRQLLVGYTTYLNTQGLDWRGMARDNATILKYGPGADSLMAKYGIDYVAIGPWERKYAGADQPAFDEHFQVAIRSGDWEVFAVSPRARNLARSHGVVVAGSPDTDVQARAEAVARAEISERSGPWRCVLCGSLGATLPERRPGVPARLVEPKIIGLESFKAG